MTPREQDCLKAIINLSRHGVSPSYDEIAAQIGLAAKSGVHRLVKSLERQGLIEQEPHRKNAITVVADNPAYTPAALAKLSPESLRRLIATASGVLAHKDGGGAADQVLRRIGDRLTGRPRVSA